MELKELELKNGHGESLSVKLALRNVAEGRVKSKEDAIVLGGDSGCRGC